MLDSDINNTYQLALAKWGKKALVMDYMEGSADLIKELSKSLKGDKNIDQVCRELANVSIAIEQIIRAYEAKNSVLKNKHEILIRLRERVKN